MITKVLKTNALVLYYEYLSDDGINLKRRQSFSALPLNSSAEDMYDLASDIGNVLRAPLKSIEENVVSILTEA